MITETTTPTLVAEGTRIQGSLTFFSGASIFGIVEGELIQQSIEPLQVGKTGWVHGNVMSQGVILIEGRVDGDVKSTTTIRLAGTATVHGKISAPRVEIKPGAYFDGAIVMQKSGTRVKLKQAA
jgi:cytoskeletal protein CcmA (bactofilin family)